MGAEVLERHDAANRGKGFALMAGFEALYADPEIAPDVVILNDADTIVATDAITLLAAQAARQNRPVQGLYLMDPPAGPSGRLGTLALLLKNYVRPLGALRLGFPCPLFGSGIALPAAVVPYAKCDGDLVEDMRLGLKLTADGHGPTFCPEARFTGVLDEDPKSGGVQRRRWEHGHLSVAAGMPWAFLKFLLRGNWRAALSALDHGIPPLMSLLPALLAIGAVAAVAGFFTGHVVWWVLLGVAAAGVLLLGGALFLARDLLVRRMDMPGTPKQVLGYVAGRLVSQSSWFVKRQKGWVRTPRTEEERAAARKATPKAEDRQEKRVEARV